jgi:hypothetical protein
MICDVACPITSSTTHSQYDPYHPIYSKAGLIRSNGHFAYFLLIRRVCYPLTSREFQPCVTFLKLDYVGKALHPCLDGLWTEDQNVGGELKERDNRFIYPGYA